MQKLAHGCARPWPGRTWTSSLECSEDAFGRSLAEPGPAAQSVQLVVVRARLQVSTGNTNSQHIFHWFPLNTSVFLLVSLCSHGKHLFSYGFPQVPTEHMCFHNVFHRFQWNTCVFFLCFSQGPTKNDCFPIVFHRLPRKTCVFLLFSIDSNGTLVLSCCFPWVYGKHVFSQLFLLVPTENHCFLIVFHRFPRKTCVFVVFSIGSHRKHVLSQCFCNGFAQEATKIITKTQPARAWVLHLLNNLRKRLFLQLQAQQMIRNLKPFGVQSLANVKPQRNLAMRKHDH